MSTSTGHVDGRTKQRIMLHPSVGIWAEPENLDARQKVAAISKVRCLEHDLFEGDRIRRSLSAVEVDELVSKINLLRGALGWLEMDLSTRRNDA